MTISLILMFLCSFDEKKQKTKTKKKQKTKKKEVQLQWTLGI